MLQEKQEVAWQVAEMIVKEVIEITLETNEDWRCLIHGFWTSSLYYVTMENVLKDNLENAGIIS